MKIIFVFYSILHCTLNQVKKKKETQDFLIQDIPGSPEAKILHSQCRGARFDSWKLDLACCN